MNTELTSVELKKLSSRQQDLLRFIVQYLLKNFYQPTMREICEAFNWGSTNSVSDHLKAIAEKGWLKLPDYGSCRAIKLSKTAIEVYGEQDNKELFLRG